MPSLFLPYGKSELEVSIPEPWLGAVVQPQRLTPVVDPLALIRDVLRSPTGSPRLGDLARPGMRVALIVDDITRKTPAHLVLPLVLEELQHAGIPPQDTRIVLALGTHRLMTDAEVQAKLGQDIATTVEIINASAGDRSQTVYLGESPACIPAWVNRAVAEADLRIGVGMITPHLEAGFSGGAKIILPGACGETTVDAFHQASAFIPENQLGNLEAPLRRDLEGFVERLVPLHFIVNLVLTLGGEVFQCVAGDALAAHRLGVRYAHQAYGAPVERRYPVVLADAAPYDQDLWQSVKGLFCGDLLVEDGGTLILLTAAEEGNGAYPLLPDYIGRDLEALLAELRAGTALDPKQAATGVMIARLRRRIRLIIVSSGLTGADGEAMGIPLYPTVGEALRVAFNELPLERRRGGLAVVPQAGVVLPMLKGSATQESTVPNQDAHTHAEG